MRNTSLLAITLAITLATTLGFAAFPATAGETVSIEVVLASVSRDVADKAGLKPEMDGAEALKKIKELDQEDKLAYYTRLWVATSEGEQGMIQFGKTVGITTGTSSRPGLPVTRSVRNVQVGTLIQVTPTLTEGDIAVKLSFEQSRVGGQADQPGGSETATVTVQSNVQVKNNYPAIIGGRFDGKQQATYVLLTAKHKPSSTSTTSVKPTLFFLKFVSAKDAARELKKYFADKEVQINVNAPTNALLIDAEPKLMKKVGEAIRKLDSNGK